MLREIGPGIAVAEAPFKIMGVNLGVRMTVVRLATGDVLLHAPVALTSELKAAVERMGRVAHVVAPNNMHHLYVKPWLDAYPQAKFYTVPQLPPKRPDLNAPTLLSVGTPSPWAPDLDMVVVRSCRWLAEAALFHHASSTLIVTDLVFNLQRGERSLDRFVYKLYGAYGKFGPTLLERLLTRDRSHVRAAIDRMAQWPIKRVIMAHGDIRDPSSAAEWRAAFAWL